MHNVRERELEKVDQTQIPRYVSRFEHTALVTPRFHGYGDVTATYIRKSEVPYRIYAKHQYKQESEYGSKWCIIHSNT